MLEGKQEFVLVDDQKVVYETALAVPRVEARGDRARSRS